MQTTLLPFFAAALALLSQTPIILSQPARGLQGPLVVSPEVRPGRQVIFRLLATNAPQVRLAAGDIPDIGGGQEMVKGTNGVWELTVGPIDPGAYRYTFDIGGVSVVDPRNPATSESNNNVWSLVSVGGSDFMDLKDVPHGATAVVNYYSRALKKFRRMHVYVPPGYESGHEKFPVFYLLHGAGDSDESWTSIGRAGVILDNLLASGKAKPMVVVMPAGHTGSFGFGRRGGGGGGSESRPRVDEFSQDFVTDIMPYVESHYRVYADQPHRAIAGLSMGGGQTLNIAFSDLNRFGYVGVFSSGLFGAFGRGRAGSTNAPSGPTWEEQHLQALDNAELKKGIKLLWMSTGTDDFVMQTTRSTVALLKKHGFDPVFRESTGGHTWINWRDYLNEFAPQLFQ